MEREAPKYSKSKTFLRKNENYIWILFGFFSACGSLILVEWAWFLNLYEKTLFFFLKFDFKIDLLKCSTIKKTLVRSVIVQSQPMQIFVFTVFSGFFALQPPLFGAFSPIKKCCFVLFKFFQKQKWIFLNYGDLHFIGQIFKFYVKTCLHFNRFFCILLDTFICILLNTFICIFLDTFLHLLNTLLENFCLLRSYWELLLFLVVYRCLIFILFYSILNFVHQRNIVIFSKECI